MASTQVDERSAMSFQKKATLGSKEVVFGTKQVGQVISVPTGRLDKVSIYLEPLVGPNSMSVTVKLAVHWLDGDLKPTGDPIAFDQKTLGDMLLKGEYIFRIESFVPSSCALVLSVPDGNSEHNVSWRYADA